MRALVKGVVKKGASYLPTMFRFTAALLTWLVVIPFLTYLIHSFAYCRGLRDVWALLKHYDVSASAVVGDCLRGLGVCCAILLVVGSLSLCQEFFEGIVRRVLGPDPGPRGALVDHRDGGIADAGVRFVNNGEWQQPREGIVQEVAACKDVCFAFG